MSQPNAGAGVAPAPVVKPRRAGPSGPIRWSGLVKDGTQAIAITERIAQRQLDPFAREVILMSADLR